MSTEPSIAAVLTAYQSERWVAETLESVLGQTRPPDEVVVVNDGSTDGTAGVLESFGSRIRVVNQPNGGYQAGMNRAIRASQAEFVALCGADDLWEPQKLEWQAEAIRAHPDVDVFCGHAVYFGAFEAEHARAPMSGVVRGGAACEALYPVNWVSTSSVVVRRSLFTRFGPFMEDFMCEDWHYWLQCARSGVGFYYDPRLMTGYRQHDANMTNDRLTMREAVNAVHFWHDDAPVDRYLVRTAHADDLFRLGRLLAEHGRTREARASFRGALRYAQGANLASNLRAVAWLVLLSLPLEVRGRAVGPLARVRRSMVKPTRVALR